MYSQHQSGSEIRSSINGELGPLLIQSQRGKKQTFNSYLYEFRNIIYYLLCLITWGPTLYLFIIKGDTNGQSRTLSLTRQSFLIKKLSGTSRYLLYQTRNFTFLLRFYFLFGGISFYFIYYFYDSIFLLILMIFRQVLL